MLFPLKIVTDEERNIVEEKLRRIVSMRLGKLINTVFEG